MAIGPLTTTCRENPNLTCSPSQAPSPLTASPVQHMPGAPATTPSSLQAAQDGGFGGGLVERYEFRFKEHISRRYLSEVLQYVSGKVSGAQEYRIPAQMNFSDKSKAKDVVTENRVKICN
ncbi:hypothetical protein GUJ93_ZPchr0010g7422 [Zizania palustris]|uniref:Uncharacterized protein n=1 Tax=Zizania palustris TaxID=103762 RepID=A0A8J5WAW0_ZIZPA|nr:hypothetical protein GUJ93_ZPchr0010g7422 [Zizania palustris]